MASQPLEVVVEFPWEREFFAQYSATRSLRLACERSGVSRSKIKEIKAAFPSFCQKIYEAELDHFDLLYENALKQARINPIVALKLAEAQVSWLAPKPPPKQLVEVSVKMEPNEVLARWNDSLGIAN